jgi:hypothetical protein
LPSATNITTTTATITKVSNEKYLNYIGHLHAVFEKVEKNKNGTVNTAVFIRAMRESKGIAKCWPELRDHSEGGGGGDMSTPEGRSRAAMEDVFAILDPGSRESTAIEEFMVLAARNWCAQLRKAPRFVTY